MSIYKYEIEDWTESVKGQWISYAGRTLTIYSVEIKEKVLRFKTNGLALVIFHEDWEDFKKEIKTALPKQEKTMELEVKKQTPHEVIRQDRMNNTIFGKSAEFLAETMKQNIKKVQDDPAYIPQAQEIGSQIKNFIELAKTEVAYLNALNK